MRTRWWNMAAATGLAWAVAGCGREDGRAVSDSMVTPGPYYNFNPADRDFVTAAAEGNLAALGASRLALGKANDAGVKTCAQQMIHHHTKVQADLDELARKKGVTLLTEVQADHKSDADRLAELSGAEFDRVYVTALVSEHVKAVSLFEDLPSRGRDPDVRAFAEKTVPTLRMLLEMARGLRSGGLGSTSPD